MSYKFLEGWFDVSTTDIMVNRLSPESACLPAFHILHKLILLIPAATVVGQDAGFEKYKPCKI